MGMEDLLSQFQQAQGKLADMEKDMENQRVEATSANGLVKAVVNGRMELLSLNIDPKVVDPSDISMLEDLVLTAVNKALLKARDDMAQSMASNLFGGNLPNMF